MTLSFIPKILGVFAVLVLAGPWLLKLIMNFTRELFQNIVTPHGELEKPWSRSPSHQLHGWLVAFLWPFMRLTAF